MGEKPWVEQAQGEQQESAIRHDRWRRQCRKCGRLSACRPTELQSAKREGPVAKRAYKALYRSYDTKVNQEKALPARLQVQRQVPEMGAVFTRRDLFPDKKVSRELWTHLPPATITMPLKSQCILDHIVQLARVKLARGTAVGKVGGKAAGSGHIRGKADLLPLAGLKTQGKDAEGGIGACFGGGQLLADSAVDVHDFHLLFLNCYTICTGKD